MAQCAKSDEGNSWDSLVHSQSVMPILLESTELPQFPISRSSFSGMRLLRRPASSWPVEFARGNSRLVVVDIRISGR
jgi:hypothetical protein